jgi:hypothetical protein
MKRGPGPKEKDPGNTESFRDRWIDPNGSTLDPNDGEGAGIDRC